MDTRFTKKIKGVIKIKVSGKHLERFIKRLYDHKIELLEIIYKHYNECYIKIYKEDLKKIKEIKSIYDICIVDNYGLYKAKKIIITNKILICFALLCCVLLYFLSNTIFSIEVVHSDKKLRNIILMELEENNIKKYQLKKSYNKIQQIKKSILNKYKDKIEWLEIESIGTKYIIRLEERKINNEVEKREKQNIISKKNAIIKKIEAVKGEVVKNINDYVKPGDVIISGNIKLYDNIKNTVRAEGKVYGEVWYQTTVQFPLNYKEEKITEKKKTVLKIKFFGKNFELFNFNPFKNKKSDEITLIKSNLLPFSLVIDNQRELEVIDEVYTEEQAINGAISLARKKMEEELDDDEYIIKQNSLKINIKDSKIEIDMFFAVYENITGYQKIEEIIEPSE